jgi:hypothetical protein
MHQIIGDEKLHGTFYFEGRTMIGHFEIVTFYWLKNAAVEKH